MKIIDFEKEGNVVRFILGDDSENNYYGDDWDDKPYEHNAGPVYDEFIKGYCDIAFPYDYIVLEPQEDWNNRGNSSFCKNDFKDRKIPCIVAYKIPDNEQRWYYDTFGSISTIDNAVKFYYNDIMEPSEQLLVFQDDDTLVKPQKFITKDNK